MTSTTAGTAETVSSTGLRPRVLAIDSRFKWSHIDYLQALGEVVDLRIAVSDPSQPDALQFAQRNGLGATVIGTPGRDSDDLVREQIAKLIAEHRPDAIHVLYYRHERLALLAKEVAGSAIPLVFEVRDPLTTLEGAGPDSAPWRLEDAAIRAADAWIMVSETLASYLETTHQMRRPPTLVVPHAFNAWNAGPLLPKLSAVDGGTHIALVGTADPEPGMGRWYGDIITALVGQGLTVHTHFHDLGEGSLSAYEGLARQLPGYQFHSTVSFRQGHLLSDLTSRYDIMGVFHEREAPVHNESATLAVCLPTKAVSAWLHGAIPVVCRSYLGGLVEWVERYDIGFVVPDIESVGGVARDRAAVADASARCIAVREIFTHQYQVKRIAAFIDGVLVGSAA